MQQSLLHFRSSPCADDVLLVQQQHSCSIEKNKLTADIVLPESINIRINRIDTPTLGIFDKTLFIYANLRKFCLKKK
jgi:hypothetical protein